MPADQNRDPSESKMAQAPEAGYEADQSGDEEASDRTDTPGNGQAEPSREETSSPPTSAVADSGSTPMSEQEQEVEQWLSRVPDDPGGLLREKLRRRYAEKKGVAGMRQGGTTWQ